MKIYPLVLTFLSFAVTFHASASTICFEGEENRMEVVQKKQIENPLVCEGVSLSTSLTKSSCRLDHGGVSWRREENLVPKPSQVAFNANGLIVGGKIFQWRRLYSLQEQQDLLASALLLSEKVSKEGESVFSLLRDPKISTDDEACKTYASKVLFSSNHSALNNSPDWVIRALARTDILGAEAFRRQTLGALRKLQELKTAIESALSRCGEKQECYGDKGLEGRFKACLVQKKDLQACEMALRSSFLISSLMLASSSETSHVTTTTSVTVQKTRLRLRSIAKNRFVKASAFASRFFSQAVETNEDALTVSDLFDLADIVSRMPRLARGNLLAQLKPRQRHCRLFVYPRNGTKQRGVKKLAGRFQWFVSHCLR